LKSLLTRLTLGLYEQDILEEERDAIKKWLDAKIILQEGKLFRLPSKYRAGTITISQKGGAYLQVVGANVRDLFIPQDYMGDVKEGDIVIATRLLGVRGTPSAKIIEVVGRAESYSIGYILVKNGHKSLVELRTGYPVGIPLSDEELSQHPEGTVFQINNQTNKIIETLGNLSEPSVDEKIVLAQYNKHDDFSDEVLALAKGFDPVVDAALYPDRKDLRDLDFCTIDPVTAKDFDDAIYFDVKRHVLFVAIADVSAYVTPFGPIDVEAIYRSFSIYLPHRSIPMLPRQLSETLCSLQPHVDRLAYVFEMFIDKESLEVTNTNLYEALIHSKRRFTYEDVDAYFEGKLKPKDVQELDVMSYLKPLRELTDKLKVKRMQTGYEFRSPDLQMSIDKEHNLATTEYAQETPSHALIEDCMLLANKAAAAKYERGVFRIHEEPSQSKLQALYTELAGIGIIVEPKESMKETINFIQKEAEERGLGSEVDTLIIRSQMRARYAPDNSGHFGLGFERYTHFTSPIRRYSDLIVHRLLKAIEAGDTEEGSYVLRNIDALTIAISEKERESADIEIQYKQRKFARWAQTQIGKEFRARIQGTDPYLIAEIDDVIKGAQVDLTAHQPTVLFEDVILRIDNVDIARAKIFAVLVQKVETH